MRVDVHAHVIVPELLREPWGPRVRWEDGAQIVELGGREIRSAVRDFVAADAILAAQDEAGIDHVVLCPWVNLLGYDAPAGEALERCRVQNAGLAALQAAHPERISVLGTVPLQDPEIAAGELEALMAVGSFAGVEIAASVNGIALGDDRLAPFWSAAEATGALVFVHPTTNAFPQPIFGEHYLFNLVGNPVETTLAAAHLLLEGVLDAHPGLKVVLAHGGGAITTLRGRFQHRRPDSDVVGAIRRFHFDTVVFDAGVLGALVDFAGADRVLLGSDYPFDMGDARPAEVVRALGLAPEDEASILGGNYERLTARA